MESENLKYQIGSNIASLRKSCGMTQAELAERINYSDKAVSKWERGESIPDVLTLVQLARLFGVTVDEVMGTGQLQAQLTPEQPQLSSRKQRQRTGVTVLSSLLVWFVAMLVYVILSSVNVQSSWVAFVYAIPVNAIVLLSLRCAFRRYNMNFWLISVIVWGVLLSVYVTLLVFARVNVWKLVFLGLFGQAAVILWFRMLLRSDGEDDCG